jgi:hypothetical protein
VNELPCGGRSLGHHFRCGRKSGPGARRGGGGAARAATVGGNTHGARRRAAICPHIIGPLADAWASPGSLLGPSETSLGGCVRARRIRSPARQPPCPRRPLADAGHLPRGSSTQTGSRTAAAATGGHTASRQRPVAAGCESPRTRLSEGASGASSGPFLVRHANGPLQGCHWPLSPWRHDAARLGHTAPSGARAAARMRPTDARDGHCGGRADGSHISRWPRHGRRRTVRVTATVPVAAGAAPAVVRALWAARRGGLAAWSLRRV